jgi:hypothetical protein
MGKKKDDTNKDFVLACFKPADESLEPKSGKFPAYEKFAKLETFIIIEISRYYLERHQDSDTPEEDALDEFLDDYDRWVGDKDRHERSTTTSRAMGRSPRRSRSATASSTRCSATSTASAATTGRPTSRGCATAGRQPVPGA